MLKRWLGLPFAALLIAGLACNTAELKTPDTTDGTSGGPEFPPDESGAAVDGGVRGVAPDGSAIVIPTSKNVTIQVQPTDYGAAIEAAIRAAKTSVHMTIYLLTDTSIIDALGDLTAAGKDVKVILNKTFPPNGGDNTSAYNSLKSRGVNVVYAPAAYTFTHAKAVVIDGAKVLIMTMNLTQTSAKDNREYIATDSDPADVADCEKLFTADFTSAGIQIDSKLVISPPRTTSVDARSRLKALIDSATTSLDVEVQSVSDDVLTDAIIQAHKDKVAVRVVVASGNTDSAGEKETAAKLKAAGVPAVGVAKPYIHAKAVVVDGTKVWVGSHNFTATALDMSRELGVITDAPAEVTKVRDQIAKDFASGTPL